MYSLRTTEAKPFVADFAWLHCSYLLQLGIFRKLKELGERQEEKQTSVERRDRQVDKDLKRKPK